MYTKSASRYGRQNGNVSFREISPPIVGFLTNRCHHCRALHDPRPIPAIARDIGRCSAMACGKQLTARDGRTRCGGGARKRAQRRATRRNRNRDCAKRTQRRSPPSPPSRGTTPPRATGCNAMQRGATKIAKWRNEPTPRPARVEAFSTSGGRGSCRAGFVVGHLPRVLLLPLPQQIERLHRREVLHLRPGKLREQLLRRIDEQRKLALVDRRRGAIALTAAADLRPADVLDAQLRQQLPR